MSKIRIPVVFVFILSLSLFTLFVSTGFAKDNKIKQTHIKKNNKAERFPKNRNNIIRWSQEYIAGFGIVSVANPDSYIAGGGPYTTIEEDYIISPLNMFTHSHYLLILIISLALSI